MTTAKHLHLRLFLEGEEVPVVSAQVSIQTNAAATASIQILPIDEGIDLKPRTMVHLFVYDEDAKVKSSYVSEGTYRLLFCGEAIGFSSVRNPSSRGLILQCIDFTGYWVAAHAEAIQYGGADSNAFVDESEDTAADNNLYDDLPGSGMVEKLAEWIMQSPKTPGLNLTKGLAGGIIRVMEIMGGVVDEDGDRTAGVNDFFTVAELRARLLQQVCAETEDASAAKLLSDTSFSEFITNGIQNIGRQVTLNDIILLLLQYIYYEYVPNPAAKYDKSVKIETTSTTRSTVLQQTQSGAKIDEYLKSAQATFFNASNKIQDQSLPKDTALAEVNPSWQAEPGPNVADPMIALKLAGDNNAKILAIRTSLGGAVTKLTMANEETARLKGIDPTLSNSMDELSGYIVQALSYASKCNSPNLTIGDITDCLAVINHCLDLLGMPRTVNSTTSTVTGGSLQRLRSVIFHPSCWFSAPPRCNVIFPEQYSSVSYDRNWVGEVTRLRATTASDLQGRDLTNLLNEIAHAPPKGLLLADDVIDNPSSYRFLMSHELHTGIVSRTMWVPDPMNITGDPTKSWLINAANFNYFSARFAPRSVSVSGRLNPGLVCGFPGAVILTPLILSESEKSKATDVDALMTTKNIPYQLVGLITGLSHNVDQNGGTTSISMSHARRHRGLDDAMLSIKFETTAEVERVVWYTITKKDARNEPVPVDTAANPLAQIRSGVIPTSTYAPTISIGKDGYGKKRGILIASTPQAVPPTKASKLSQAKKTILSSQTQLVVDPATKRIIEKTTRTTRQVNAETTTPPPLDVDYTKVGNIEGVPDATKVQVPNGEIALVLNTTEGLYGGKIIGVEVVNKRRTSLDGRYVFEAIRVYEKIKMSVTHSPPLEDLARPTWLSDGYANENISDRIYQPFLGCRSVVDEVEVNGVGKGSKATYLGSSNSGTQVDSSKSYSEIIDTVKKIEESRYRNSVDRAITWWSYIYGQVKSANGTARDIEKFVRDFTARPIATIDEMLGTADLKYTISGSTAKVSAGSEGFHSSAVHPDIVAGSKDSRLLGLLSNPDSPLPRMDPGGPQSTIPKRYDVRYEKKQAVLAYKDSIVKQGRGLRG